MATGAQFGLQSRRTHGQVDKAALQYVGLRQRTVGGGTLPDPLQAHLAAQLRRAGRSLGQRGSHW